jgi:hypothetical protein
MTTIPYATDYTEIVPSQVGTLGSATRGVGPEVRS